MAGSSLPQNGEVPQVKRPESSRFYERLGLSLAVGQYIFIFLALQDHSLAFRLALGAGFTVVILFVAYGGPRLWHAIRKARGYDELKKFAEQSLAQLTNTQSDNANLRQQLQALNERHAAALRQKDELAEEAAQASAKRINALEGQVGEHDEQIQALNALAQALIDFFTSSDRVVHWAEREVELVSIRNIPPPYHLHLRAKTSRELKEGERVLVLDLDAGVPRGLFQVLRPTGKIYTAQHSAIDRKWWELMCARAERGDASLPTPCKAILLSQEGE